MAPVNGFTASRTGASCPAEVRKKVEKQYAWEDEEDNKLRVRGKKHETSALAQT